MFKKTKECHELRKDFPALAQNYATNFDKFPCRSRLEMCKIKNQIGVLNLTRVYLTPFGTSFPIKGVMLPRTSYGGKKLIF